MDILRTPHSGYQKIVLNSLPNFVTHSARARTPLSRGSQWGEGGAYVILFSLATLLYNT